jgi:hypothetical protein
MALCKHAFRRKARLKRSPMESRRQDLLATARRLSAVSNIRLVVSCKAIVWNDFTFARGEPTGIEDYLYKSTCDVKGFVLQPMSEGAFGEALKKYQEFYGVGRGWEDTALSAARKSPFFMRVLFEVAQKRGGEHIVLDSVEYFEKYLDQAIARLKHHKAARLLLASLANALFAQGEERLSHGDLVVCAGNAYSPFIRLFSAPRLHSRFYLRAMAVCRHE